MNRRSAISLAATVAAATASMLSMSGCNDVETDRIPLMNVRIQFATVGDWNIYGISGAATTRRFIRQTRGSSEPAGFPYTALSATGYGGVMLVGTYTYSGNPLVSPPAAFDLACPVEQRQDVRIVTDYEENCARCPVCGSTYDIVNGTGMPLSGVAAREKYGLRRYRVSAGSSGEYIVVTN